MDFGGIRDLDVRFGVGPRLHGGVPFSFGKGGDFLYLCMGQGIVAKAVFPFGRVNGFFWCGRRENFRLAQVENKDAFLCILVTDAEDAVPVSAFPSKEREQGGQVCAAVDIPGEYFTVFGRCPPDGMAVFFCAGADGKQHMPRMYEEFHIFAAVHPANGSGPTI